MVKGGLQTALVEKGGARENAIPLADEISLLSRGETTGLWAQVCAPVNQTAQNLWPRIVGVSVPVDQVVTLHFVGERWSLWLLSSTSNTSRELAAQTGS